MRACEREEDSGNVGKERERERDETDASGKFFSVPNKYEGGKRAQAGKENVSRFAVSMNGLRAPRDV